MAFSTVAIFIRHYFKYFDFCVHIFNKDSLARNTLVFNFFFMRKFSPPGFLFWCFTVPMNISNSLITTVHLCLYAIKDPPANRVFIQSEIVRFSTTFGDTYDFFRSLVDNNLCFYGVFFLLARVVLPLFFLGRSIGHSVTSTSITSMLSSSSNAFLPGSLNLSSFTRVFSTQTIVS